MSSIVNKVKEAIRSDKTSHTGTQNNTSNAATPRVDGAMDPQAVPGAYGSGPEYSTSDNYTHGTGATSGAGFGTGPAPNTTGPHTSDMMNKADPRVDSDLDGSRTMGANKGGYGIGTTQTSTGPTTGTTAGSQTLPGTGSAAYGETAGNQNFSGTTAQTSTGATGTIPGTGQTSTGPSTGAMTGTTAGGQSLPGTGSTAYGETADTYTSPNTTTGFNDPEGTHGPHNSRMMNAADPRVDSDRDHRGAPYTSAPGTGSAPNTAGPHGNDVLNKVDPRVDSDRDHRGTAYTSAPGTGPAPNTAGPHKSDVLNKMDPRVDSDLDGSQTMGNSSTRTTDPSYPSHGTGAMQSRDPTDASQVLPSVMRRHMGDPTIEHNDHLHNRERRNSAATHQETFRGI